MSMEKLAIPSALRGLQANIRDYVLLFIPPAAYSKHRSSMSLPDSYRSFGREVPKDNPAICVSSEQAQILPKKVDTMYLSRVTA
jgi:hypothetical protein